MALLFIFVAPLTVFYSLGWRIDWKNKKITQPGILYLRVWPKSAQVFIDGKLEKKTDFFFGSLLIENLIPKKYNIEIKKEGFQNWKKTLEIEKGLAAEARNIVLIPEKLNLTTLSKNVDDFFISPDEKKIFLKELVSPISENPNNISGSTWALKIFELEKNVKSHLIEENKISKEKIELSGLKFSPDSKKILLEVSVPIQKTTKTASTGQTSNKIKYYILELDKLPSFSTPLSSLDSQVEDVYFNPLDSQKIIVLKSGVLNEIDLSKTGTPLPILENIVAFSVFNGNIYYLASSGFLFKTDPSFSKKEKLNISKILLFFLSSRSQSDYFYNPLHTIVYNLLPVL